MRHLWDDFMATTGGVVFMVDSCDSDRLPEVEEELAGLAKEQSLEGVPIAEVGMRAIRVAPHRTVAHRREEARGARRRRIMAFSLFLYCLAYSFSGIFLWPIL